MRDRFHASDASCRMRFHTQTGGVTLQAQQPLNNVVRVTVQALAAVLGGTQSLHTNGYDEALSLPSEVAATLALRTQQIIAHESGVTATVDPLAGSYYVEHLTDELERRADGAHRAGGCAGRRGRERSRRRFFQEEIARSAPTRCNSASNARGDTVVVGVNRLRRSARAEPPAIASPDYSALERDQVRRVSAVRSARDDARARQSLQQLADAAAAYVEPSAAGRGALMPLIIDAVRARASVGEIADMLGTRNGGNTPRRESLIAPTKSACG